MEADGFIPYTLKVWVWVARLHTLPGLYLSFWPVASIWNLVPGVYDCISDFARFSETHLPSCIMCVCVCVVIILPIKKNNWGWHSYLVGITD